jgi:hypothetical protein
MSVELLEDRCLLSAGIRPIDEVGNNLANPTWGMAGTDLLRVSPVAYADGISTPSQPNTLSPREISNALDNQSNPIFSGLDNIGSPNAQRLSDFSYAWGQFIDHDMDLTLDNSGQPFNIPADPTMPNDNMGVEPFTRSQLDPNTGTSTSNPRQQVNAVTSYLDLSQVYGSTDAVANALRTFQGGLLKTSPGNLLPFNNLQYFTQDQLNALNMANDAQQVPSDQLFAAGDRRANENIELISLTTLFVRNHNRIATELAQMDPVAFGFTSWTDENLYQEARKINIATEEYITYYGYLPSILGPAALPAYTGYNPNVNAGIATEFSTVGFRFGHSLLSSTVGRDNNDGTGIADPNGSTINLTEDFFRPDLINPNGGTVPLVTTSLQPDPHISSDIGPVLKALADGLPNETDLLLIDEVRNVLFGIPNAPGTDLAARDIQRARDHGIGTYNQVRVAYGLPAVTSFADITSNVAVQTELRNLYGTTNGVDNVNAVDPFIGMLAEDHVPGADVGPTAEAILVKQFAALRDGDRFFFLNERWNFAEIGVVLHAPTLAKVIEANTGITNLQSDVFFNRVSIGGTVLDDDHGTSRFKPRDVGVPGVTVELFATGNPIPVATTTTDSNGHYEFTEQTGIPGTGTFTVQIVVPPGFNAVTPISDPVALTRGNVELDQVNFGVDESGGVVLLAESMPGSGSSSGAESDSTNTASPDVVKALLSTSSGTTTTPATGSSGTSSDNQGPPATDVSPQAVANLQLAVLRNSADGSVAPVDAIAGASPSTGSNADSFWSVLAAVLPDLLE